MALEHVAQGQTRFFTPGVAPDPRGILLGRLCLMTFPTLEGAVSWLRLYSAEAYLREADLRFSRLLFRLSLRKLPGSEKLSPEDRGELYLAVAHGLADGIIRYLWRNRVEAQAGLFNPRTQSAFDDHARERG